MDQKKMNYVIKTANKLTNNEEDREDLAQDSLVKIHKTLKTFNGDKGKFTTWAYRVVKNVSIDKHRREHTEPLTEEHNLISDGCPNFLESLINKENIELLHKAIDSLNDKHKEILTKHYFDGKDYFTLSKELNMPMGSVGSRMREAKINLRESFLKIA